MRFFLRQRVERGDDGGFGVHLKEAPESRAGVAAAKAVRAERDGFNETDFENADAAAQKRWGNASPANLNWKSNNYPSGPTSAIAEFADGSTIR